MEGRWDRCGGQADLEIPATPGAFGFPLQHDLGEYGSGAKGFHKGGFRLPGAGFTLELDHDLLAAAPDPLQGLQAHIRHHALFEFGGETRPGQAPLLKDPFCQLPSGLLPRGIHILERNLNFLFLLGGPPGLLGEADGIAAGAVGLMVGTPGEAEGSQEENGP
jgi:hypothetical protein